MRIICCDAKGKVYAAIINTMVYKLAMDSVAKMESTAVELEGRQQSIANNTRQGI